jgi:TetR/AcrR family transcriptional regulator
MSEDKRERIITAAKKSFAEKGFSAVGIREIAKHAGINSATLYHYFKNKDELYAAVLEKTFEQILSIMEEITLLPREMFDQGTIIRESIYRYMDFLNDNRDFIKIMIHELNLESDLISKISQRHYKGFFSLTGDFITRQQEMAGEDVDRKDVKQFLISGIGLCIIHFLTAPIFEALEGEDQLTPEKLEERKEAIVDIILNGVFENRFNKE